MNLIRFKKLMLFFVTSILFFEANAQLTSRQERNLVAFSKMYGYMRYFHPADEAKLQYWTRVAIRGSKRMLVINNDEELINELKDIFTPLGPSVKIFRSNASMSFNINEITPMLSSDFNKLVSWQHLGLNLYSGSKSYQSIRLNRKSLAEQSYEGLDSIQLPLTEQFDVSTFKGGRYLISFVIKVSDPYYYDKIWISSNGKIQKPKFGEQPLRVCIEELIPDTAKVLTFRLKAQYQQPIALDSTTVRVISGPDTMMLSSIDKLSDRIGMLSTQDIKIGFEENSDPPLFKEKLPLGSHIKKELVKGISCIVPLVLYGNASNTFPVGDSISRHKLSRMVEPDLRFNTDTAAKLLEVRFANILIAWNALKHSFPYWKEARSSPDKILLKALRKSFLDKDQFDFLNTLKLMFENLNDGHGFVVFDGLQRDTMGMPLKLVKVDGNIVVKDNFDTTGILNIKAGDIIKKINGLAADVVLEDKMRLISGSPQWKSYKALLGVMDGDSRDTLVIQLKRAGKLINIAAVRPIRALGYRAGNLTTFKKRTGWLDNSTFYFDLTSDAFERKYYNDLIRAKAVIFDLRGYPLDDRIFDIIGMLIKVQKKNIRFFTPKILLPDFENMNYKEDGAVYNPSETFIPGKIAFLADESSGSAVETFLGLVKDFKLGEIVGRPSAGLNGNINQMYLTGNYRISFSGLRVKNSDGSSSHIVGIKPDIEVSESMASILRREDLVLKKALYELQK